MSRSSVRMMNQSLYAYMEDVAGGDPGLAAWLAHEDPSVAACRFIGITLRDVAVRSNEIYELGLPNEGELIPHTLSFTTRTPDCVDRYILQCYDKPFLHHHPCGMSPALISDRDTNMVISLALQVLICYMLAKCVVQIYRPCMSSIKACRVDGIFIGLSCGFAWLRSQVHSHVSEDVRIVMADNKVLFCRKMLLLQPVALAAPFLFYAVSLQLCWAWVPDNLQSMASQRILYDSPLVPLIFQLNLSVFYLAAPARLMHSSLGRINVLVTAMWIAHLLAASTWYFESKNDTWIRFARVIQAILLGNPCKSFLLQSIVSGGFLITQWRIGQLGLSMIVNEWLYLLLVLVSIVAVHHVEVSAASHLVELRIQKKTQSRLLAATMDGYLVLQDVQESFKVSEMDGQARDLFGDADICSLAENPQDLEHFLQAAATVHDGPALLQRISFKSGAGTFLLQCFAFFSAQGLVLAVRKDEGHESDSTSFFPRGAQFDRQQSDDSQTRQEGTLLQTPQASVLGAAHNQAYLHREPTKEYIEDLRHVMFAKRFGSQSENGVDMNSLHGVTIAEESLSDITDLQPATINSMAEASPEDQASHMTVTRQLDNHKRRKFRNQLHECLQKEDFSESIKMSRYHDELRLRDEEDDGTACSL
eukprot:TRINITY_DN25952_c0_g1_i1.p1 TRINITY_DN25952_c0_g1~~TRINITY_DN25952_c0_g1_i1.p1  ORF type:complete len:646 (+),score=88.66 TRINITY_DN25952_c0_g1_i1:476-2413(+)